MCAGPLNPPPPLTVAIIKEVGDGSRGAAAPRFGGVNGGEDGGHEPLVTVHSEALFAELGVVVGQTEKVACGTGKGHDAWNFSWTGEKSDGS